MGERMSQRMPEMDSPASLGLSFISLRIDVGAPNKRKASCSGHYGLSNDSSSAVSFEASRRCCISVRRSGRPNRMKSSGGQLAPLRSENQLFLFTFKVT